VKDSVTKTIAEIIVEIKVTTLATVTIKGKDVATNIEKGVGHKILHTGRGTHPRPVFFQLE
jgi:hypothetical protein